MELYEINPHIRYIRVGGNVFKAHSEISICYDARIFFFESGRGSVTVNGKKHPITDGTLMYFPPLSRYRFTIDEEHPIKIVLVNFDLTCKFAHIRAVLGIGTERSFDESLSPKYELPSELSEPIIINIPTLKTRLLQCNESFRSQNEMRAERASAYLKLCIVEMLSHKIAEVRPPIYESVMNFIKENYQNHSVTNQKIAEKFNYHPNHLNLVIKKHTGMSLREYIIHYRLEVSKELLLSDERTVSEIAWDSGFCSAAYFTKMFKEKNGITPMQYRRIARCSQI